MIVLISVVILLISHLALSSFVFYRIVERAIRHIESNNIGKDKFILSIINNLENQILKTKEDIKNLKNDK